MRAGHAMASDGWEVMRARGIFRGAVFWYVLALVVVDHGQTCGHGTGGSEYGHGQGLEFDTGTGWNLASGDGHATGCNCCGQPCALEKGPRFMTLLPDPGLVKTDMTG